jgi:hypothetical protein
VIGQVTGSPDISQGHVLRGLGLSLYLGYNCGLGEVSLDLFVSEMVRA